jgi:hypothetical protein
VNPLPNQETLIVTLGISKAITNLIAAQARLGISPSLDLAFFRKESVTAIIDRYRESKA